MTTLLKFDQAHRLPADADLTDRDGRPHIRLRESGRTVYYPLTADGKKYLKPNAKWTAWVPQADGSR